MRCVRTIGGTAHTRRAVHLPGCPCCVENCLRKDEARTGPAADELHGSPAPPRLPPPPTTTPGSGASMRHADDHALLEIARSTRRLEHKLAAVEALASEAALRQGRAQFRRHDRKVHQRAGTSSRAPSPVATRQTPCQHGSSVATLRALLISRRSCQSLAEIDREWGALLRRCSKRRGAMRTPRIGNASTPRCRQDATKRRRRGFCARGTGRRTRARLRRR